MKERRYKEEYSLETSMDDKGRFVQKPVYQGDYYWLPGSMNARTLAKTCLPYLGVFIAVYVLYLRANSPSSRCMYVLPFAACACIPMFYAVMGAFAMLRAPRRMTHVQRENGIGRLMRSCMGCGVLTGIAAAGDIVYMALGGHYAREGFAFAMLAIACIAGFAGFKAAKAVYSALMTETGAAARERAQNASQEGDAQ